MINSEFVDGCLDDSKSEQSNLEQNAKIDSVSNHEGS